MYEAIFFILCYASLLKDHTHSQCRRILVPGHRLKCMTGRKSAFTLQFWHWFLFGAVQHMQQLRDKDLLHWQSRRESPEKSQRGPLALWSCKWTVNLKSVMHWLHLVGFFFYQKSLKTLYKVQESCTQYSVLMPG